MKALLSLFALLFSINVYSFNEGFYSKYHELPSWAQTAWSSTVRVSSEGIFTNSKTNLGSGFIIDAKAITKKKLLSQKIKKGYRLLIATNEHVIKCPKRRVCNVKVGLYKNHDDNSTKLFSNAKLIYSNDNLDIAFITLDIFSEKSWKVAQLSENLSDASYGDLILSIGHPDLSLRTVWQKNEPKDKLTRLKRFSIGQFNRISLPNASYETSVDFNIQLNTLFSERINKNISWISHTSDLIDGNSGGPLINSCGYVIGMNTWVRYASAETKAYCAENLDGTISHDYANYALPISTVIEIANNIDW